MKTIPLTRGAVAIVDDEDFERVAALTWQKSGAGYAVHGQRRMMMHRFVLGDFDTTRDVDHINRNKLDNRKANLRIVSRSVNRQNADKPRRATPPSSRFIGVTWKRTCWYVQICVEWKKKSGGYFHDEVAAAKKYDELALRYYGPLARVNFPREDVSST